MLSVCNVMSGFHRKLQNFPLVDTALAKAFMRKGWTPPCDVLAERGRLDALKAVHEKNLFARWRQVVPGSEVLKNAAKHGHLEVLLFLINEAGFGEDHVKSGSSWVLRTAIFFGHFAIVKWLCTAFSLDLRSFKVPIGYYLTEATIGGHIDILRWIHETYTVTREEVTANENAILRAAVRNKRANILQWLKETFDVSCTEGVE